MSVFLYHSHLKAKAFFPSYLFFACSTIILWWFTLQVYPLQGMLDRVGGVVPPLHYESEPEQRLKLLYRNLTNSHFNNCLIASVRLIPLIL